MLVTPAPSSLARVSFIALVKRSIFLCGDSVDHGRIIRILLKENVATQTKLKSSLFNKTPERSTVANINLHLKKIFVKKNNVPRGTLSLLQNIQSKPILKLDQQSKKKVGE